jgi:hypothetical protein
LKIRIVIPLWKRPLVTRFCFDGLVKLIRDSKHELKVTCVISEKYYEVVCKAYGFEYVYAENDPLGAKINKGIIHALSHEWDYLMIMNSDDIIKADLINKYYEPFFESLNPFFGVDKVTYVNFYTKEAREFQYEFTVLGIGKCIRRDVVEKMRGKLYRPLLNRCLDDTMMDNVIAAGYYPTFVKYQGMLAMDFKSETNIWPWERFKNRGIAVCYKQEESGEVSLIAK